MTKHEYQEIASAIFYNDWDELSTIEAGKFTISQFQSAAFDSNYKCYKVLWTELTPGANILIVNKKTRSMVAKIEKSTEEQILKLLSQKGFPVPKIEAILRTPNGKALIFLEMLPGEELYSHTDESSWICAAMTLSQIHREFLTANTSINATIPFSNRTADKLHQARLNTAHNTLWTAYMDAVSQRFSIAPKTLIHGDMFPTNILVHRGSCKFIDWENAGISPYMMDIGRLTAIIDERTLRPMCPYSNKVIQAYYEKMAPVLRISYNDYLNDIYMAQFVELANWYSPPNSYWYNKDYNQRIKQAITEIVNGYFKTT